MIKRLEVRLSTRYATTTIQCLCMWLSDFAWFVHILFCAFIHTNLYNLNIIKYKGKNPLWYKTYIFQIKDASFSFIDLFFQIKDA